MRYLLSVSYDGSKFCGFQRQKNDRNVQSEIELALRRVVKQEIEIKGAGRTDRGVHAYDQKCHFDLVTNITPEKLRIALNDQLGKYIYIKSCEIVADEIHARFSVKEKEYVYKINQGEFDPMLEDYTFQINYKLDIKKMKKASKFLIGKHDYASFVSGESGSKESVIKNITFSSYGDIVYILIKGTHFYRYMIRNIVGALLEVGKGKIAEIKIKEMLDNPTNKVVLPTAVPQGLYLLHIEY